MSLTLTPLGDGSGYTAYTPTVTGSVSNPGLGSTGTASGRYVQIGKHVHALIAITFAGSGITAGSGDYRIGLPVPASTAVNLYGFGYHYDASAGSPYTLPLVATVGGSSSNTALIYGTAGSVVGSSNPAAPAVNDMIVLSLVYEAA